MVNMTIMGTRRQRIAFITGSILFLVVFLKNAWVCDDAYILFRSLEQLMAGNGPVWNPQVRVQVFTSVLWYWILAAFRAFSSAVFINAILASSSFCLAMLLAVRKILPDNVKWLLFIALLACSSGFFDYTTSGLENPLGYFLIALYLYYYHRLFTGIHSEGQEIALLGRLSLTFGLIILCRHDLATLLLVPSCFVLWEHRRTLPVKRWTFILGVAFLPVFAWTIFSIIYYGSPFPNAAYAKLNTGIPTMDLLRQGIRYLLVSFRYDTITPTIIVLALFCPLFSPKRHVAFLSYGIMLNLVYIVFIGGDFVQGRLLSFAYLLSVIILVLYGVSIDIEKKAFALRLKIMEGKSTFLATLVFCLLYMCFYPHTPVNTPLDYQNRHIAHGIADERGVYFRDSSLWAYLSEDNKEDYFPDNANSRAGFYFRQSPAKIYNKRRPMGAFGYWAGPDKIIIDPLALSDPFLARLPVHGKWRIGHFPRAIPAGYEGSLLDNSAQLENTRLN